MTVLYLSHMNGRGELVSVSSLCLVVNVANDQTVRTHIME